MKRNYGDDYRGWPVAPRNRQHPIRGSFLDPRTGELYHQGVDVSVRDDQPEPGAPPGCAHKVYAIEGGDVWQVYRQPKPSVEGIVRVGHFGYGHVDPIVKLGQPVKPGQHIGWTVRGEWHVHLTEWRFRGNDHQKRTAINPLGAGGKLAPYVDLAPPEILDIRFTAPASPPWGNVLGRAVFPDEGLPFDPEHLFGLVDVRARIEDPQSFRGWFGKLPILETNHHPARVHLTVTRLSNGAKIVDRDVFTSDVTLEPTGPRPIPISQHYAPGSRQNLRAQTAVKLNRDGKGQLWFRLFARPEGAYWDTSRVPNGRYRIRVAAWDVAGNRAGRTAEVAIKN